MKKILILVAILTVSSSAFAQRPKVWENEINYQVSFPLGDFDEFTGVSYTGFQWQFRRIMKSNPNLQVGGLMGWHYFQDKKGWTTDILNENEAVSGNIADYTNILTIMPMVYYRFGQPGGKARPYISAGAGMAYQDQRRDIGIYTLSTDGVQFATMADLGVMIRVGNYSSIALGGVYHYMPSANDMVTTSFVGIKLGYIF
jgi:Lipid A 3-O-deacylase (PagL)